MKRPIEKSLPWPLPREITIKQGILATPGLVPAVRPDATVAMLAVPSRRARSASTRARACRRSQDEHAKAVLDRLTILASAIAAFEEESLSVRVMVKKGTRTLVF